MEVSLPTVEKLEPGSQKHLLSFHKQQAEDEAVEDHKPSQDLLSEERHKQGYEHKFEKEHVMKVLPFEEAESLGHTFLDHVSEHTRARSNSHNLLVIPSFLQQNFEEMRSSTPNKVEQKKEIGKNSTEKQSKSPETNNIIEDEKMAQKPAIPIPIEQFTPVKETKPVKKIRPAKQFVEAEDPELIVINNEIRNIRKEKELEMPHRPSSILKYRKMNTLESKHESEEKKSEETKEEISASNPLYDNSCLHLPLDSNPPLETFTDDNGLDLLIDSDEDHEVTAQIDAALAGPADPELVKPAPLYLPTLPANKEYTLVLDLDETLIHYRDDDKFYLVRPGVPQFLTELSQLFDIVLFTAGVKKYADCIVDNIDPQQCIAHRLYRRHTVFRDAMYIKDLSLLGRDLAKTLIIDNLYESFLSQPQNRILVKSWYDDMEDTELLTLLPFLKGLVEDEVPDIREVLKQIMNSSSDPGDEDEEYLES